jgi:hypothetical protein
MSAEGRLCFIMSPRPFHEQVVDELSSIQMRQVRCLHDFGCERSELLRHVRVRQHPPNLLDHSTKIALPLTPVAQSSFMECVPNESHLVLGVDIVSYYLADKIGQPKLGRQLGNSHTRTLRAESRTLPLTTV